MEFGIRELLIVAGVFIFLVILIDGIRRFVVNRKNQIKMAIDAGSYEGDDDDIDWYSGELPQGGARIKAGEERSFEEPVDILMEGISAAPKAQENDFENQQQVAEQQVEERLDEEQIQDDQMSESSEPSLGEFENEELSNTKIEPEVGLGKNSREGQRDLFGSRENQQSPSFDSGLDSGSVEVAQESQGESVSELPEEVIAINIIAKGDEEISGDVLLEAVLKYGFRFGDMSIFHRHEHSNGQGPIIFSMANAVNPGIFDIDNMSQMHTKGVTLFMRLSQLKKPVFSLELMLDIAKRLANEIGAELRDDTHSVLSSQTVAHYKNRIHEYERKYLTKPN